MPGKRKCKKCNKEFDIHTRKYGPYKKIFCSKNCRECFGALKAYHIKKNKIPNYNRKYDIMKLYGITLEQYDELHKIQDNKCAICFKSGKLFVDHNHITGRVRGLLCYHCNFGIGHLREDLEIFYKCIEYLKKEPYEMGSEFKKKKSKGKKK